MKYKILICISLYLILGGVCFAEYTRDSMTIGKLTLDSKEYQASNIPQLTILADSSAYVDVSMIDAGGLKLDITSDGTAEFNFLDELIIEEDQHGVDWVAFETNNTSNPTNGSTLDGVIWEANTIGTINAGTSYQEEEIGHLLWERADDYHNAANRNEHDGKLSFYLNSNGTPSAAMTMTRGSVSILPYLSCNLQVIADYYQATTAVNMTIAANDVAWGDNGINYESTVTNNNENFIAWPGYVDADGDISGMFVESITKGTTGDLGYDWESLLAINTNDNTLRMYADSGWRELAQWDENYVRYYHLSLAAFDPGASGATWHDADANTTGGWQLDNANEHLHSGIDVHNDWDGVSNLDLEIYFAIADAGAAAPDTVDIKIICYYAGEGDAGTKTQTIEEAIIVGAAAQWTVFKKEFEIVYNEGGNVVDAGDIIGVIINLETDTSEVDDIYITHMSFYYNTTHVGIQSGDA